MARISRHNKQLEQTGRKSNTLPESVDAVNHTAIYARLSLCDNIHHVNEDSIESQLRLLRNYVSQHPELHLAEEYVDRGWTGMNFQRPAFLRMIEDIQAGRINCIVVKDLSRFGRNYWETGYFLEVLLPHLNIRFIAVADRFDSMTYDPGALSIILKNILNDYYSRDLSRRFSDSYDLRKEKGVFRKGQPYGYIYDPDRPKHLTFDPELSYYVRMLFTWALEEIPSATIAKRLREMNAPVPAPMEFRYNRPDKRNSRIWNRYQVDFILKNRTYTGDFVCGKSYTRKCDPFNYRPEIPETEWIVVPGSHPGYITHEEYARINQRLKAVTKKHKQQTQKNALQDEENPNSYKGKLVCPVCGRVMCSSFHAGSSAPDRKYICFNETQKNHGPHYTNIRKTMLDIIVLNQLQEQFQLAELLSNWLRSPEGKRRADRCVGKCQDALNQASRQFDILKAEQTSLFEHYADYIINEEEYAETMSLLKENLNLAANKLEKSAQDLATLKLALTMENPWLKLFTSLPYPNEVTADIVQKTIDKIIVRSKEDAETHFLCEEHFTLLWRLYKETDK